MLLSAANVAGSVCEDTVYDAWNRVLPEGCHAIVRHLKKAYGVVVVRRKDARDTSDSWFVVTSVESSVVGSPKVSRVYESPMLSKSEKWSICPSPHPLRRFRARIIVQKVLRGRNVK